MQSCPASGIVAIHVIIPINRKMLSEVLATALKVGFNTFRSVVGRDICPLGGFEILECSLGLCSTFLPSDGGEHGYCHLGLEVEV